MAFLNKEEIFMIKKIISIFVAFTVSVIGLSVLFNSCSSDDTDVYAEETAATTESQSTTKKTSTTKRTTTESEDIPDTNMVWISEHSKRYHSSPSCSNIKKPSHVSRSDAESMGLTPCAKCW